MAERDRFDLDLRAALRAFAEDAPTDVRAAELARRFAVEHPRGRTLVPQWRPAALPRLAWVLVLVGLLLALGAGALMVGSRLARSVPAVLPPIGQTYVCPPGSMPDEPGPAEQARSPEPRSAIAFDRRAGRLVAVANAGNGIETWTFDVCTNTWTQMHPNRQPPTFEWAQSVYDVDSDVTILVSYQAVWTYDLTADTWSEKGAAPTIGAVFLAYDPVSGLVIANGFDSSELWTYDVETDTWTPIQQANAGPSQAAVIAYDASVDRLVAYGDGTAGSPPYETWLFDIRTGTWSRSAAERPAVVGWLTPAGIVYDEAAKRSLVFDRAPLTTYDATADRWDTLADRPFPVPTVYDAVNRRLVGWGGGGNDLPEGTVVALELATGDWTVLLEPSAIPDEALVADLAAVWSNPFDEATVSALYAPDAMVHDLVEGLTQTGLEEIGARIRYLNAQDFKVVATSAPIRQDSFVASFVKFGGGEAAFPGLVVYELKDGKVVNQWVYPAP